MPLEMNQLQKLDDYRWLVPRGTKPGMLTDALIYANERLLQDLLKDLSLEQAINVAMLPGIVEHEYGEPDDLTHSEESGAIEGADPSAVSDRAKKRGLPQIGTLGSGNHFLEVQYVERIFEPQIAQALGLYENEIAVLIHSGSRGLGHQVCTDYLRDMDEGMRRYGINLPDRQLACVPVHSKEGQSYLGAMRAAANFAWANRQGITHFTRQAFKRIFGEKETLR